MGENRRKVSEKRDVTHAAQKAIKLAENRSSPTAVDSEAAWARGAVTFRLTAERKRALRSLSKHEEETRAPTAALDLAIELAIAGRALDDVAAQTVRPSSPEAALLVDELREAVRVFTNDAQDWSDVRAQLTRVVADCAELRSTIASAAMLGDGLPVTAPTATTFLKSWLDREADPARAWILAKAKWIAKRSAGPALAEWEFEIHLIDDRRASSLPESPAAIVVVGPAPSHASLSTLELAETSVLVCSRSGKGWSIEARAICGDGKLGEVLVKLTLD